MGTGCTKAGRGGAHEIKQSSTPARKSLNCCSNKAMHHVNTRMQLQRVGQLGGLERWETTLHKALLAYLYHSTVNHTHDLVPRSSPVLFLPPVICKTMITTVTPMLNRCLTKKPKMAVRATNINRQAPRPNISVTACHSAEYISPNER